MAVRFLAIIDQSDLPEAARYYRQFPREPSPRGAMRLTDKNIKAIPNITLGSLLDKMALIDDAGVALLICHGVSTGLLIPLAKNGVFAERDALDVIMSTADVDNAATQVKSMPAGNETQVKAKLEAWKKLFTKHKVVKVAGEFTLTEAENVYRQWFDNESKRLGINSATLRDLIRKMKQVRSKRLNRVEIRACSAGKKKDTMKTLKRFFGCQRLLAPSATTFFLSPFFIDSVTAWPSIVRWNPVHREREAGRRVRLAGPLSRMPANELRSTGQRREFLKWGAAFVMKIWELELFKYAAMGAAGRPLRQVGRPNLEPNWEDVRQFIHNYVMPASTYRRGPFRAAGFWEPDYKVKKGKKKLKWVLPNEPEYLSAIQET